MFKQSRIFFSIFAVIFFSTLSLSINAFAKTKCPIPEKKTLLSLYLQSDLVISAEIKSEKNVRVETSEYGDNIDVERRLEIIKTFKGQKLNEVSFVHSQFKPKTDNNENDSENTFYVDDYNYGSKLIVGKKYLFFLSKDTETGTVAFSDYMSGARELDHNNSLIVEKRMNELGKILANKKNQIPNLAEWTVRLAENSETRWDGASILQRSFNSLNYNSEFAEDQTGIPTEINEDFNEYSPQLAKSINDSQKSRLSAIFIDSINQFLLGGNAEDLNYDYQLAQVVANWDSARLAIYGFGMLQAIDRKDFVKTERTMNFITDMIDDNRLSEIYYEYSQTKNEESSGESEITETPVQIAENAENINQITEIKPEIDQAQKIEKNEEAVKQTDFREKLMQDFTERYQYLLARNFVNEVETNVAENSDK